MKELPRLSKIETLILNLLSVSQEMYGLEMVEASRGKLKRGTVYVTLNRMQDKGYITSKEVEAVGRGPARCVYRLTGHGARVLAAWQMAGVAFAKGARA